MPRRTVPDPFSMMVGARIRQLRHERGMSLGALGDAAEVSKGHLSSIEHGLAAITVRTIDAVAAGLDVPPMYILAFPEADERVHVAELLRILPAKEVTKILHYVESRYTVHEIGKMANP